MTASDNNFSDYFFFKVLRFLFINPCYLIHVDDTVIEYR